MNVILFRSCKQLCGNKLIVNLPKVATSLNVKLMGQTTVHTKNNYTGPRKSVNDVGLGETKNRFSITQDFDESKDADLGEFSKLGISDETIKRLKDANINHLFAVQYDTFDHIKEGKDVIVQARTGTGKTLAFVLPILENLCEKDDEQCVEMGRAPMVLVLAPTRELALQTCKEFEKFKSQKMTVSCIYGASPYPQQEADLHNGIDILVGTPGRILDHIRRKNLDCSNLKHVILDEADLMLDMGFQNEIDKILLSTYTEGNKPQTLLFSATIPPWVEETARKYTSTDMRQFDFIGTAVKSAVLVEHKAISCSFWGRAQTIRDIMQVYCGKYGKTLIFTSTKQEANELALNPLLNMDTQVLHGGIRQRQRELTLEGFRTGKFNCLIATDVASRGLDIPEIDLVIQTEPPKDVDFYIHRAGRTGRAGRNGVSIVLYKPGQKDSIRAVERIAGVSFARISAPQQEEVIHSAAYDAVMSLDEVKPEVIQRFIPSAKSVIESQGAENALAVALAYISGMTEMRSSSLLTSKAGYTTYLCKQDSEIRSTARIWGVLKYNTDESFTQCIRSMQMCKNRKGCVFDVPTGKIKELEERWRGVGNVTLEQVKELPELLEDASSQHGEG